MSIPIANIINSPINGSYKLQSQSCLNNPQPVVSVISTTTATTTIVITPSSNQNISTEQSSTTVPSSSIVAQHQLSLQKRHEMASTVPQPSIEEDGISIDSVSVAVPASHNPSDANNTGEPITLSKKAIHQRDADENLFLRFLELDPPVDAPLPATTGSSATGASAPTGASATGASAITTISASAIIGAIGPQGIPARRLSSSKLSTGRTPFTITKRLTRTPEKGFGFSVVWTHPPRVEKVEPGLSADKNGIHTGDYVIFVDKHNVVTMPEADVLNLIRSQGNTLLLEIFRRSGSSVAPALSAARSSQTMLNGGGKSRVASVASNYTSDEIKVPSNVVGGGVGGVGGGVGGAITNTMLTGAGIPRPSTACSTTSIETTKRRLHLPQVTFSKESIAPLTDNRRKILHQLVSREQNFVSAQHFGMNRFVQPLQERKDLISPNDHRTLFQNIDELIRISEDILDQLVNEDQEPQLNFTSRVYLSKSTAICAAYKKYCNGIKRADCVLVNKSRQSGSDFIAFITEPQVPRKRPDLTQLIHRPLQHFREILKLMQLLASHCHVDSEEHKNFTTVINELQAAYREITVSAGFMEPHGEGRPLLTLQDLEARLVFTRCKPFTLAVQGRQWVFGGDLSRVEGRSVKPYWTLLFSDIILFAKVSRDRVLFITEEPIPLVNVIDSCFNIRKKGTEFRLTIDPNGRMAESPTGYCAPDLTRTPKKGARRKCLILRAPSMELKAVWQNLLQRQIFLVNAALGQTPLSSPLDSPDVLNTLLPLSDLGLAAASMKLSLIDSINQKNIQQVRLLKSTQNDGSYENLQKLANCMLPNSGGPITTTNTSTASLRSVTINQKQLLAQLNNNQETSFNRTTNVIDRSSLWLSLSGSSINTTGCGTGITQSSSIAINENQNSNKSLTAIPETIHEIPELISNRSERINWKANNAGQLRCISIADVQSDLHGHNRPMLEFSLSSVGRSFIDESEELEELQTTLINPSIETPETPTPNISPTSSNHCQSDTFSNDFVPLTTIANTQNTSNLLITTIDVDGKHPTRERHGNVKIPLAQFGGSWDLLELDLDFHEVNLDPNFDTDVEECVFHGDDPFGILPIRPTPPDSLDL